MAAINEVAMKLGTKQPTKIIEKSVDLIKESKVNANMARDLISNADLDMQHNKNAETLSRHSQSQQMNNFNHGKTLLDNASSARQSNADQNSLAQNSRRSGAATRDQGAD